VIGSGRSSGESAIKAKRETGDLFMSRLRTLGVLGGVVMLLGTRGAIAEESHSHYIDIARFIAEQICEHVYGDTLPTLEKQSVAKATCGAVTHPLYFLQQYEPEWWKKHEPDVLRNLENRFKKSAEATQAAKWCRERLIECWGPFQNPLLTASPLGNPLTSDPLENPPTSRFTNTWNLSPSNGYLRDSQWKSDTVGSLLSNPGVYGYGSLSQWWTFSSTLVEFDRDDGAVYEFADADKNVIYIGSTDALKRRLREHLDKTSGCISQNAKLYRYEYTTNYTSKDSRLFEEFQRTHIFPPFCNIAR
jgi:hypothetical protein